MDSPSLRSFSNCKPNSLSPFLLTHNSRPGSELPAWSPADWRGGGGRGCGHCIRTQECSAGREAETTNFLPSFCSSDQKMGQLER